MSKNKINDFMPSEVSKILLTFFCIISFRMFLDFYFYPISEGQVFFWQHYVHGLLYFFAIFLSFALLLHSLTKANVLFLLNRLSKIALIILAVPFVDFLLYQKTFSPLYVSTTSSELLKNFFLEMNPFNNLGITMGIYFSAFITLFFFFHFVYQKTQKLTPALFSVFGGYSIFFLYSILPSFVFLFSKETILQPAAIYQKFLAESWLAKENLFLDLNASYELVMTRFFWLLIILQLLVMLFVQNKKIFTILAQNLRWERIFNYSLIACIGIIISEKLYGDANISNPLNLLTILCFFVLLALNAVLAVFVNDQEDISIDIISNPTRPLATNAIPLEYWQYLRNVLFFIIIIGSIIINIQTGFLLLLTQAVFYLYSSSTLKLKRHYLLSALSIALTTILVAMSGFYLVSPDKLLSDFPVNAILIIGFTYSLLSHIKDLKDYEGDKSAKIQTLPVVFGLETSKKIIAILYAIIFLSLPFLLSIPDMRLLAIAASLVTYFLITRNYHEKYVFFTKFIYMLALYLLLK